MMGASATPPEHDTTNQSAFVGAGGDALDPPAGDGAATSHSTPLQGPISTSCPLLLTGGQKTNIAVVRGD